MSDRSVGSVETEARLLAQALTRVNAPTPQEDEGDEGRERPPLRLLRPEPESDPTSEQRQDPSWVTTHAPEALRSLADVADLLADGLRTLAGGIEESGRAAGSADAGAPAGGTLQYRGGRDGHDNQDRSPAGDHDEQQERA